MALDHVEAKNSKVMARSGVLKLFILLVLAAVLIYAKVLSVIVSDKSDTEEFLVVDVSRSPMLGMWDVRDMKLRSVGRPLRSPVCYPSYGTSHRTISRIYFMHMRKAGGSTIHMYLKKVAKKWNLELHVAEGTVIELPEKNRSDTLYVTHLREPIARVISHFKYEARWPCEGLVEHGGAFVPTVQNAVNFSWWIDEAQCRLMERGLYGSVLWECSSNCYIQWIGFGKPVQSCNPSDIAADEDRFQQALATLSRFHLIIDVERLFRDREYGGGIEHYFGKRGLVGYKVDMYCGKESAAANRKHPLVIENATYEKLKVLNRADSKLFQSMTQCAGPVHFPGDGELRLKDLVAVFDRNH